MELNAFWVSGPSIVNHKFSKMQISYISILLLSWDPTHQDKELYNLDWGKLFAPETQSDLNGRTHAPLPSLLHRTAGMLTTHNLKETTNF